jgi:hypothetical protein
MYNHASDTQRHPLWGPTQVKVTHAAEPSSGPLSAVHISGRVMRPLEPASSSMGRLETSGSLCTGENTMRHFMNEGHSTVVETVQGFETDGAESVTWTTVFADTLATCPGPGSWQRNRLAGRSDACS